MIRGACRVSPVPGSLGRELRARLQLDLDLRLVPEGPGGAESAAAWRVAPCESHRDLLAAIAPHRLAAAALAVALAAAAVAAWGAARTLGARASVSSPAASAVPVPERPSAPRVGSAPAASRAAPPGEALEVEPSDGGARPRVNVVSATQLELEAKLERAEREQEAKLVELEAELERARLERARLERARLERAERERAGTFAAARKAQPATSAEQSVRPPPGQRPPGPGTVVPQPAPSVRAAAPAASPGAGGLDLFDDTR